MSNQQQYEVLFSKYPDVVSITQFCSMLGGIAESTARKFLQAGAVQHFRIHRRYYIPKRSVIAFILSDYYLKRKRNLKHKIRY